uniref:Uncharacterized protein n=1 Tax=Timema poppense TaxID=170557 RepID=A0A7R9D8B8_TIMPO|nr:unnamed protein product [Timema poppensis]
MIRLFYKLALSRLAGMYKYIGTEETISALKHLSNELPVRSFAKLLRPDIKMRRIFRLCNPPEDIVLGSEAWEARLGKRGGGGSALFWNMLTQSGYNPNRAPFNRP